MTIPQTLRRFGLMVLHGFFPPRCLACGGGVASDFGLCPDCWRETDFVTGPACTCCGAPLPGGAEADLCCDDCQVAPPNWDRGVAVLRYAGTGRRLVLALKHGDRLDLAHPLGTWLAQRVAGVLEASVADTIIAPVPLHPLRMIRRRYNQSALLSKVVARHHGAHHVPDLFQRLRATPSQEGRNRQDRHVNVSGAMGVHPRHIARLQGKTVVIVDDVMTSGATLSEATRAAYQAGAAVVHVAVLARVAKDA